MKSFKSHAHKKIKCCLAKKEFLQAMLVAGVDDAGRGPVIGPLVVGSVLFKDSQIPKLQALGARDSKALTPSRREALSQRLSD
jgi:ribonuclease HII